MPVRPSVAVARLVATTLLAMPALAGAQSVPPATTAPAPTPLPTPAVLPARPEPVWHVSANPIAPLALSFYGDAERRVAEMQSLGVGIGFTNLADEDALLTVDGKYRFWLGDREFQGWSIAPTFGLARFSEDRRCNFPPCPQGSGTASTTRGALGVQVDHTWRTRRGRVAVTAGIGAKRFLGGDESVVGIKVLPNARLSIGVLF